MILKNGKRLDGMGDSMPIGSIVEYNGTDIPDGWEILPGDANVYIGPTEPTEGQEVWIKQGVNLLNIKTLKPQNGNRATVAFTDSGFNFTYIEPLVGSGEGYYTTDVCFKKGQTYYFHLTASDNVGVGNVRSSNEISGVDDDYIEWERGSNGFDFFATMDKDYNCFRIWMGNGNNGYANSGTVSDIMITGGEDASDYTPYVNKEIYVKTSDAYVKIYDEQDNMRVHSHQERLIGSWFGKPLYERTWSLTTPGTAGEIKDMIYYDGNNIGEVVRIDGMIDKQCPVNYFYDSSEHACTYAGLYAIRMTTQKYLNRPVHITVQYTRPTN